MKINILPSRNEICESLWFVLRTGSVPSHKNDIINVTVIYCNLLLRKEGETSDEETRSDSHEKNAMRTLEETREMKTQQILAVD